MSQYRFYGEPVVKAAVENGCHHLDISGEPEVSHKLIIGPLSPNSDQHLISPHNITDSSNIQITRMNEMTTKDEMSS